MPDDIQVLLAKRRCREAIERLLDQYEQKVFRMALAILGDVASAQDATQDVFLKVWKALPHYDGRAAASTWLYTIARNTCLSAVRRQRYRRATPLEQVAEPSTRENGGYDVELLQCVSRLPEIERQVIVLFYWEDRSIRDVAEALGIPEGTVKSHLHRARKALGKMLRCG